MTGQLVAISHSSIRAIAKMVLPEIDEVSSDAYLRFVVSVSAENIVARDFAAFLEFLDRIYGRSHKDFHSYSRRQTGHFKFAKCQQGSWELIAEQALGVATSSSPLVVMWLVLKYLPSAVLSVSSAYNQYEQGRLARANRQRIREELRCGGDLEALTPSQRAEVARMIERVLHQEASLIPRLRRFMADSFIGVRMSIDKKEVRNRGQDELIPDSDA